jgi:5-dehydro-2-deoxygluconokinase
LAVYDLITVGRVTMDLFSRDIGAPFEDVTGFDAAVGGSPTNIAIGASRLGLSSLAFTAVGDDRVGDFVLRFLGDQGVETAHVSRKPGKATSLALVGVQPPDRFPLTFYRQDPADVHLTVEEASRLPIAESSAVLLSGNVFGRGSSVAAARFVAEAAHAHGLTTFLDLDLRPTEWPDLRSFGLAVRPVLPLVDVVIGTEEEFDAALSPFDGVTATGSGVDDLEGRILQMVAATGASAVLKRGERGAAVTTLEERREIPGFDVDVVNTVGAGDSFAAGLILGRLRGWDWERSARFANACGAITVTRHGCSVAFPAEPEVAAMLSTADAP